MDSLLHTPEGVRDIYNEECSKKNALSAKLDRILKLYGYKDIQTPTFEFFDIFNRERGSVPSRNMYKFIDRDGSTLVLRPDITPSIARCASKYYMEQAIPIRLCYTGNTFRNNSSYQGRLKENTQSGAELIGDGSVEADAEMLAMVVDGLKKTGLKEFQVSIGHVDFLKSLMDETKLSEEIKEELYSLILNRNFFGVDEVLTENHVSKKIRDEFQVLPELMGGVEVLKKASAVATDNKAKKAVARMLKIYKILAFYGVEDHITFDMSMCGNYGYYTGVVFKAYTYGTGDAVVSGGRYDHLIEKFGKQTPSIGFAIIIDELMSALSRQKIAVETEKTNLIVYTDTTLKWAVSLAKEFRLRGKCMELIKREELESKEVYVEYGRQMHAVSLMYLNENRTITMVNLRSGKERVIDVAKRTKTESN